MTDKLYTPENCKLVGEWLGLVCDTYHDNLFPVDECALCHDTTQLGAQIELFNDTPELIREALVKDGLSVYQNYDRPMLELREIGGGDTAVFFDKNWNDTDPTFRHRLFAATVEYLEGKK